MRDKPVIVEWDDATSHDGYLNKSDNYKVHQPILARTIGFLSKKDSRRVIISSESFPQDKDHRHVHTIPRKMVKRIIYLEEKHATHEKGD